MTLTAYKTLRSALVHFIIADVLVPVLLVATISVLLYPLIQRASVTLFFARYGYVYHLDLVLYLILVTPGILTSSRCSARLLSPPVNVARVIECATVFVLIEHLLILIWALARMTLVTRSLILSSVIDVLLRTLLFFGLSKLFYRPASRSMERT
jgi:hypothetical protein